MKKSVIVPSKFSSLKPFHERGIALTPREHEELMLILELFMSSTFVDPKNLFLEEPVVCIKAKKIQTLSKCYKKFLKILLRFRVILLYETYAPGKRYNKYKLSANLFTTSPVIVPLVYKWSRRRKPLEFKDRVYRKIANVANEIIIPPDTRGQVIIDLSKHWSLKKGAELGNAVRFAIKATYMVNYFNSKCFKPKVDKNGRLYTSFALLPKLVRKIAELDNQQLSGYDISSTQSFLLLSFIRILQGKSSIISAVSKPEFITKAKFEKIQRLVEEADDNDPQFHKWQELVEKGHFYTYFMQKVSLGNNEGLVDVKKAVLICFNDSFKSKYLAAKCRAVLKSDFSLFYNILKVLKEGDYREASTFLLGFESNLIFKHILPAVFKEYPEMKITTIHDCFFTKSCDGEILRNALIGIFSKVCGVVPMLKKEA